MHASPFVNISNSNKLAVFLFLNFRIFERFCKDNDFFGIYLTSLDAIFLGTFLLDLLTILCLHLWRILDLLDIMCTKFNGLRTKMSSPLRTNSIDLHGVAAGACDKTCLKNNILYNIRGGILAKKN